MSVHINVSCTASSSAFFYFPKIYVSHNFVYPNFEITILRMFECHQRYGTESLSGYLGRYSPDIDVDMHGYMSLPHISMEAEKKLLLHILAAT